ncbi:hypothetical protein JYU20_00510 [Bacteroidales bacterium AH-315-I05]|nr:hypothetical protein [Bacteroidales bacterium AH-315-I05]
MTKKIIYGLAILVGILLVIGFYAQWNEKRKLKKLLANAKKKNGVAANEVVGDVSDQLDKEASDLGISQDKQIQLTVIAETAYDLLTSFFALPMSKDAIIKQINALPDNELEYVAKYYQEKAGESLHDAVGAEYLPWMEEDVLLQERLKKLGLA